MSIQALPGNKPPIRFGCRVVAYMPAETPRANQDQFIREFLVDNTNSLKVQSTKQPGAISRNISSWEAVSSLPPSIDGWGVVAYLKNRLEPWLRKAGTQAATDPAYDASVEEAIRQNPQLIMAHIRQGENPGFENAHPFQHERWSFMHNGTLEAALDPSIRTPAEQFKPAAGTTDTEIAFHYFLSVLRDRFGTIDSDRIPKNQLAKTFREVSRQLIELSSTVSAGVSKPVKADKLRSPGIRIAPNSQFKLSPAANFIASDGQVLMASCYGRKLFLGLAPTGKDGTDVLIASEPLHSQAGASIQWTEIPDSHSLIVQRNGKDLDIEIQPF